MESHEVVPPAAIPTVTAPTSISPILLRLLECPVSLLPTLSAQVLAALDELPTEDRPTSYEGLLDVARFCVEEEPGWSEEERAKFLGGHPRIGRQKGAISKESEKEQGKAQGADEETMQRLDKLNFLYERRFPTLCFVTYVAGRPRNVVADELEALLGPNIVGLAPADAQFDPDDVAASWAGFPAGEVRQLGSDEWSTELKRGEDALWEIAGDRALKLVKEVQAGKVTVDLPASSAGAGAGAASTASATPAASTASALPAASTASANPAASTASATPAASTEPDLPPPPISKPQLTVTPDVPSDNPAAFDVPFLSEATFRALILASPVLTTFFEQDLPQSFLLQPVERQTSTKDAFLSALNDAGQGGRGVTRERVKGLLGGLLGDVADAVGNRLQQQTVSGPKPSFNRRAGGRGISLEEAARTHGAAGKLLAPVSPAALGRKASTASLRSSAGVGGSGGGGGVGSAGGATDAAEALRLAQEALSQRDTSQFVIDAPGDETEDVDGGADAEVDEEEEELDIAGGEGDGLLTGKEAQLAKDLRSAEAQ